MEALIKFLFEGNCRKKQMTSNPTHHFGLKLLCASALLASISRNRLIGTSLAMW